MILLRSRKFIGVPCASHEKWNMHEPHLLLFRQQKHLHSCEWPSSPSFHWGGLLSFPPIDCLVIWCCLPHRLKVSRAEASLPAFAELGDKEPLPAATGRKRDVISDKSLVHFRAASKDKQPLAHAELGQFRPSNSPHMQAFGQRLKADDPDTPHANTSKKCKCHDPKHWKKEWKKI